MLLAEEDAQLPHGAIRGIRSMNDVMGDLEPEIATVNRKRGDLQQRQAAFESGRQEPLQYVPEAIPISGS